MNWGKIHIACRIGGYPDPVFFQDWTRLVVAGLRDGDRVMSPVVGMPQHYAAERIANNFLAGPCDSVLYLDDDMSFLPADLDRLRDDPLSEGFGAVSALCVARGTPHRPIVFLDDSEDQNGGPPWKIPIQPEPDTILEVGFIGLAFALVRRETFVAVRAAVDEDHMMFRWDYRGDSEDATFGQTCRECGVKMGVNTGVSIGHTGTVIFRHVHDPENAEGSVSGNVEFEERANGVLGTIPKLNKELAHGKVKG